MARAKADLPKGRVLGERVLMVFVTVGTHEQPFDRLMREIERLVAVGVLEDAVVQYGYSTVQPAGCRCKKFLPYDEMLQLLTEADIVITHGGPSTFIEAMSYGKTPIVVPRQAACGEHVNDHQIAFVRQFSERIGGIIPVYKVGDLVVAIEHAVEEKRASSIESNNMRFCEELRKLVEGLQ